LRFTKNFHREKSARFTTAWRELRSRSLETAVAPRRTLSQSCIFEPSIEEMKARAPLP
jgi:hypothetical protein